MYTSEENVRIVIALLKAHGVRKIIASPGATNVTFVGSVQNDPFFQLFSAIDERHAGYLAVGMAAESGEPVVLSCTGATASRNYLPALTEAYYRKLPILAITGSRVFTLKGQLTDQFMDRTQIPKDVATVSVWCPVITADHIRRYCARVANEAILALKRRGGGPAHVNLETQYSRDFSVAELPDVRKIERYTYADRDWPTIGADARVAVYVGSHKRFTDEDTQSLARFVRTHQAIVVVSPVSSYSGCGAISDQLLCTQGAIHDPANAALKPDLTISIGEISADYGRWYFFDGVPVWRVSEDGEIRDQNGTLENVFEVAERLFFDRYADEAVADNAYLRSWREADAALRAKLPELPFCNNWIGRELYGRLPKGCSFHAGILSSVRSMGYMEPFADKESFCNVGGFGIDGNTSTLIGASLCNPDKLFVGMVGDLSFFYDLNALGNRHVGRNVRLLVVNNGMGAEFTLYGNCATALGDQVPKFIGAGGHFGPQSRRLVKHYAEDLGFRYLSASTQDEFLQNIDAFLDADSDRSVVMECFVDPKDEYEAWQKMSSIATYDPPASLRSKVGRFLPSGLKSAVKSVIHAS